jgi:hypothetical protein
MSKDWMPELTAGETVLWSVDTTYNKPIFTPRKIALVAVLLAAGGAAYAYGIINAGVFVWPAIAVLIFVMTRGQAVQNAVTNQRVIADTNTSVWYSEFTGVTQNNDTITITTNSKKSATLGPLDDPEMVLDLIEGACA